MSTQTDDNILVTIQPTVNTGAPPPQAGPTNHGGWRAALSTCWHAIMPCIQVALEVGSEAARTAIDAKLAHNRDLTSEQKIAISSAVATAIKKQGTTTSKAIDKLIDNATLQVVLADAAKETARNVIDASEALLDVGSQEAQDAIDARLANNTGLTRAQKAQISDTVKIAITNEGRATIKVINALVDKATFQTAFTEFGRDTARVVADAAEALLEVGSAEAQEAIGARLEGNSSLTPQQKDQIFNAVSVAIQNQGRITIKALNEIVDGTTAHAALMSFGQGTILNVSATAQKFMDLSTELAQRKLHESLESSFSSVDPVLRAVIIDGIMRVVMEDMRLTEEELQKLVAMHVKMAPDLMAHFSVPEAADVPGHDTAHDNYAASHMGGHGLADSV